jgi:leader peptidase (prepilin peptidase)/N-methyltransferase
MSFLIILLGVLLGSFLNICIYKILLRETITYQPSFGIFLQYPVVEILTSCTFFFIYKKYGLSILSIKYMILAATSIIVGFIDFFTMDIYYITILPGFITGVLFLLFYDRVDAFDSIIGFAIGYSVIWLIDKLGQMLLGKKSMGEGDALFLSIIGLLLGIRLLVVALFIAFISGGIISAYILIFKSKSKHDYIPFAPFLGFGAYFAVVLGDLLIKQYFTLF